MNSLYGPRFLSLTGWKIVVLSPLSTEKQNKTPLMSQPEVPASGSLCSSESSIVVRCKQTFINGAVPPDLDGIHH